MTRHYAACVKHGIKGIREIFSECAIARLLMAVFPDKFLNGEHIRVYPGTYTTAYVRRMSPFEIFEDFTPSGLVCQFAIDFDRGRYPDLVEVRSND